MQDGGSGKSTYGRNTFAYVNSSYEDSDDDHYKVQLLTFGLSSLYCVYSPRWLVGTCGFRDRPFLSALD